MLGEYPEFPVLWKHNAKRERSLTIDPDRRGVVRDGCHKHAAELWDKTSSRLHFNRDFQINSQPLAACLTERPSIGGRAWPNFMLHQLEWELPVLLWANTILGLMSFWWLGTRQQQGRSVLTISRLPDLLTLDARQLDGDQIAKSESIFQSFREREFLPANEAYRDEARQSLDRAVLVDLLNLSPSVLDGLAILREQWCREPSVHGGKLSKPDES